MPTLFGAIPDQLLSAAKSLFVDEINKPDGYGRSLLHRTTDAINAARYIAMQANPNYLDINRETPLHAAARHDCFAVAKELINAGAEIDPISEDERTPFHIAINKKHFNFARQLIQYGADINVKNNLNQTPLHLVVRQIIFFWDSAYEFSDETKIAAKALVTHLLAAGAKIDFELEPELKQQIFDHKELGKLFKEQRQINLLGVSMRARQRSNVTKLTVEERQSQKECKNEEPKKREVESVSCDTQLDSPSRDSIDVDENTHLLQAYQKVGENNSEKSERKRERSASVEYSSNRQDDKRGLLQISSSSEEENGFSGPTF